MPYIALDPATAQAAPTSTLGVPLTSVGETLATMQDELQQMMSQRADVLKAPARQKKWINRSYQFVCSMISLPELNAMVQMNLVADQPLYRLPTDLTGKFQVIEQIKQPVSVVDSVNYLWGGRPLIGPISPTHYYGLQDLTDEPVNWGRYNNLLFIYPTPKTTRVLLLPVQIRPVDLVLDTDSPIIPPKWHEAIVLGARWRAFRDLRVWNEAALAKNDMLGVIRPVEDREAEERAAGPSTMRPIRTARQFIRRQS